MSYIGFFKGAIKINQFRISENYLEFEALEEYKTMKAKIKQIYNEIYNNK